MKYTTKPNLIKFAVLTNSINCYGKSLLFNLCKHGFKPDCVIIENHNGVVERLYQFYKKNGFKEFILEAFSNLFETKHGTTCPNLNEIIKKHSIPFFHVKNHNSKECEEILKERNINLVLLGGTRIIRRNIFEIPEHGTLNAHPGLLYKYRGLDVIYWALKNNDNPGVTLHYVNESIDLGSIIYTEKIDNDRFSDIDKLEEEADKLSAELMINAINELNENRRLTPIKSQSNGNKLYNRMKYYEKREIRQKFNAKSSH